MTRSASVVHVFVLYLFVLSVSFIATVGSDILSQHHGGSNSGQGGVIRPHGGTDHVQVHVTTKFSLLGDFSLITSFLIAFL